MHSVLAGGGCHMLCKPMPKFVGSSNMQNTHKHTHTHTSPSRSKLIYDLTWNMPALQSRLPVPPCTSSPNESNPLSFPSGHLLSLVGFSHLLRFLDHALHLPKDHRSPLRTCARHTFLISSWKVQTLAGSAGARPSPPNQEHLRPKRASSHCPVQNVRST